VYDGAGKSAFIEIDDTKFNTFVMPPTHVTISRRPLIAWTKDGSTRS
jgi:hypothetical protein